MNEAVLVYMTASSQEKADKIASVLVGEKLAACVNILPSTRSVYVWKGLVERSNECTILAKMRSANVERMKMRVTELHSYECPCILVLPIIGGHENFLQWISSV
jgi:periplasmic divalent cation tolerance protein